MEIGGVCPPEFCEIKDIFKNYFVNQTEDGANFSVVKNGNIIINLLINIIIYLLMYIYIV